MSLFLFLFLFRSSNDRDICGSIPNVQSVDRRSNSSTLRHSLVKIPVDVLLGYSALHALHRSILKFTKDVAQLVKGFDARQNFIVADPAADVADWAVAVVVADFPIHTVIA